MIVQVTKIHKICNILKDSINERVNVGSSIVISGIEFLNNGNSFSIMSQKDNLLISDLINFDDENNVINYNEGLTSNDSGIFYFITNDDDYFLIDKDDKHLEIVKINDIYDDTNNFIADENTENYNVIVEKKPKGQIIKFDINSQPLIEYFMKSPNIIFNSYTAKIHFNNDVAYSIEHTSYEKKLIAPKKRQCGKILWNPDEYFILDTAIDDEVHGHIQVNYYNMVINKNCTFIFNF